MNLKWGQPTYIHGDSSRNYPVSLAFPFCDAFKHQWWNLIQLH